MDPSGKASTQKAKAHTHTHTRTHNLGTTVTTVPHLDQSCHEVSGHAEAPATSHIAFQYSRSKVANGKRKLRCLSWAKPLCRCSGFGMNFSETTETTS